MDGNGETTILNVKIGNHHTERTMKEWLFRVPGVYHSFIHHAFEINHFGGNMFSENLSHPNKLKSKNLLTLFGGFQK